MFFQGSRLREKPVGVARSRTSLVDQILWLISLRWMAAALVVISAVAGTFVFPVLTSAVPLYVIAAILLACNALYALAARRIDRATKRQRLVLAMVQIEVDLLVLTAVLFFSGGVVNPFFLFYVFHVIIATIILPRNLSFVVGLTSIALFGLLAANELHGGVLLGYYPLQLSAGGGLWRNPVYGSAGFVAFAFTVTLAQHLTRVIIARLTSKELEAARNSDLLRAIINAMAEGLMFVTEDGRVSLCNPAAQQWRRDPGTGNGDVLDSFPTALAEHVKHLTDSNNPDEREHRIQFDTAGSSHRFIEAKDYSVTGLDGTRFGHVIVGQDLTEHKKLEADLLERTEELTTINEMLKMSRVRMAQREKMVALGQMAAGIAHEIGNPLTSLSSVVQYLGRKCPDQDQKELCAVMDHHVGRISAILKRLLTLARPATAEYKWVDINEVIENTLSLVRFDKRTQGVTIVHSRNSDLPMVWLNPQNVEQCLLNIVINALDAMDAKGAVRRHRLEVVTAFRDEMVEIRVSDTGVGMSQEVCRRAFESFFTTKEISRGTGLGLFVSYNLLAEIDGAIELESSPGEGTTAIVRIPVHPKKNLLGASERKAS
jgi:signal transduction histidine kinase